MGFEELLADFDKRKAKALSMGGAEKLQRRHASGLLNARERIAYLIDEGSFIESGLFAASSVYDSAREKTPADGKVTGYARLESREIAVVSNDFTVMGASSSLTNGKKIGQIKRIATQRGLPIVFLGESSGARMPDIMGSKGMGTLLGNDPTQYQRMRETPWASAVLGFCFGSSTWYACCSDFNVMRKGAVMAVSSPKLVSLAIKEEIDQEALGGWRLHAETTGLIDKVTETDEEALDAIKQFLGYLPSHHNEPPPQRPVPEGSGNGMQNILDLLPPLRTQVYDVRKVVRAIIDLDSYFELKPLFGKVAVTALARLGGNTVGIVANNPFYKGGALDADACDKITSLLVMCDSFNIPVIIFVDTPGFIIGTEAERRRAPGKIMNFMNALSLCTVPKLSVILRKSYGQAFLNMGGGRNSDEIAAWPTAEISFMDPHFAVQIVHGLEPGQEGYDEAFAQMACDNNIWDMASAYAIQSVIRPEETRDYLIRMLETHRLRLSRGVGQHLMRTWPTTY
jgi:acetyl-CoA carboxylase carboxyltransferase component